MTRNKLNEEKYSDSKLHKNEFIELSLKNSLIKNAKQHFLLSNLHKIGIPLMLGKFTEYI